MGANNHQCRPYLRQDPTSGQFGDA